MILSERWTKNVQDYEQRIQVIKLRNEFKKLAHNFLELCRDYEEERGTDHEQTLNCHDHNSSKDDLLESSPIFDSYELKGNCKIAFDLSQCEQEPESEDELFDDKSNPMNTHCHDLCDEAAFELIGEPVFDSYEQENGDANFMNGFTNDLLSGSKEIYLKSDLVGNPIQDSASNFSGNSDFIFGEASSCAKHENSDLSPPEMSMISTIAVPKGLNLFNEHMNFAKHDPPMFWESSLAANSHSPSSKDPYTHGQGLLDFYIEDDELKDIEKILSGLQHQDLRSNLQQPGVNDAGARTWFKSAYELNKGAIFHSTYALI